MSSRSGFSESSTAGDGRCRCLAQKLFCSFLNLLKLHISNHTTMIQRSLYRTSKHIAPRISQRTLITPPPRLSPAFIRLPAVQQSSTRLSSRWYSDAAEAKTTPTENSEAGEASKSSEKPPSSESQPSETQTLKAELEAKNKEIIDLKVLHLAPTRYPQILPY